MNIWGRCLGESSPLHLRHSAPLDKVKALAFTPLGSPWEPMARSAAKISAL